MVMVMSIPLILSDEQKEHFSEFIRIKDEIALLEKQAAEYKKELDDIVNTSDISSTESIIININDRSIEYSKVSESIKFDYDVQLFLSEVQDYSLMDISVTKARKALSAEQIDQYFRTELGGRKMYVK
jgi:hypothetical protein